MEKSAETGGASMGRKVSLAVSRRNSEFVEKLQTVPAAV
jgi:hypothetical protein